MKQKIQYLKPNFVIVLLLLQTFVVSFSGCGKWEADRTLPALPPLESQQDQTPEITPEQPVDEETPVAENETGEDAVEVFYIPNPKGHTDFIELVSKARKSINLKMFRLTVKEDAEALARASLRKIKVRVILDRQMITANKNKNIMKILQDAGVEVKPSSKGFSITHEKSMSMDSQMVMISTINLTGAYKTTRGIGVVSKDKEVIKEYDAVFEADWKNAERGTVNTPALKSKKLLWSPNNAKTRLVQLIQSAKKSIEVYVENFSAQEISRALSQAADRGVRVRVITPLCDLNSNPFFNVPMMNYLNSQRVETKMMPYPSSPDTPYIHAKSMIIDGERSYVGSVNFSRNSFDHAREVGIVFKNTRVASDMQNIFEQDWSRSNPSPVTGLKEMCRRN